MVVMGITPWTSAQTSDTRPVELPVFLKPFPTVLSYASRQNIPMSGISVASANGLATIGDEITALVNLESRSASKQWLITLRVVPLTDRERRAKAPTPLTLYTSTGRRLEFGYKPIAVELLTRGPFFEDDQMRSKPREKRARALLNGEFLALGLDGASRTGRRIHEAARKYPARTFSRFAFSSTPFPEDNVAATKTLADAIGLTAEDERAFTSMMPALFAFYNVAQNAPGLSDILDELIDKRSLIWSFFRHGGELDPFFHNDMSGIRVLDSAPWQLDNALLYRFPVTVALNGKPTLTCALAVTAPHPPLLACGGILAVAAEPTERDGRRLTLRVLAARTAKSSQPQVTIRTSETEMKTNDSRF